MIICPRCGKENYNVKFCVLCGSKLSIISAEVTAEIDILKIKVDKDPLNPKLYLDLGNIYYENQMLSDALLSYQKVINLEKNNFEALLKSGDIYLQMNEYQKAEKAYTNALNINLASKETKSGLLKLYLKQEKDDLAIDVAQKIIVSDKSNIEVHKTLKELYQKTSRETESIKELETLTNLLPHDEEILLELAALYESKENYEEALNCYNKILRTNPNNIDAKFGSGIYYCTKGNYQKCIENLQSIIKNIPDELESKAHLFLSIAYSHLDDYENAVKEISKVSSLYDEFLTSKEKINYAESYYKIGNYHYKINKLQSARDYFKTASFYDEQNKEYSDTLKKVEASLLESETKKRKKLSRIIFASIALIIIGIIGWNLIHGDLEISVKPDVKIDLFIDGKLTEVKHEDSYLSAPFSSHFYHIKGLFIGQHEIRIENSSHENWEELVNVGSGETSKIDATLNPSYNRLEITSSPDNADIYINGNLIGRTPYFNKSFQTGEYNLLLKKVYYKNYTSIINIKKNKEKSNSFNFDLAPGSGTITITDYWPYVEQYEVGKYLFERSRDRVIANVTCGEVEVRYTRYGKWYSYGIIKVNDGENIQIMIR